MLGAFVTRLHGRQPQQTLSDLEPVFLLQTDRTADWRGVTRTARAAARIVLQHLVELANRLVKELPSPTIIDSPGLLYG